MKMLSINKSLICFNWKYCLLNQEIRINTICEKKRFLSSKNCFKKFNQFLFCNQTTSHLSNNLANLRCFSTKTTKKVVNIEPISRKRSQTTAPVRQLVKESDEQISTDESIGIVGIHKWEDLKGVNEWICVYHFPLIAHLKTFQRLKLWITVFNIGLVPTSLMFYNLGSIPLEAVAFYSLMGLFSMFAMYIFGHLFSRFVGRIYVSDDAKFVRLSHLSFFGKRIDTDIDSEDVVPLMLTNHMLNDWYCGIERYSTDFKLYMSLKFGGITNREAFEQVFGEDAIKFLSKNR